MTAALLAILILVLAAVLWRRFSNGKARPTRKRSAMPPAQAGTGYRCVSIDAGLNACRAAHRLTGRRFLPREAPALPLATCDEKQCACRYVHHSDRRDDDRRDPFGRFGGIVPEQAQERRGRDRRRRS